MKQLLPPNSTKLELKVSQVLENTTNLAIAIKKLVKPSDIPSQFLPHLAWQNSVDRWNRAWSDDFKRKQIQIAFDLHKRKGTISAFRSVVESFGFKLEILEWWQKSPTGTPGTFEFSVELNDANFDETEYNTFIDLINDNKPLTRHFTAINFKKNIPVPVRIGSTFYDGQHTTIYPELPELIVPLNSLAAHFDYQITAVYPQV